MEKDIKQALSDRESFQRLRSRALWLKGGDKNTKFFHRKATQRRKNNMITGLFDETGRWTESQTNMEQIVVRCRNYREIPVHAIFHCKISR